MDPSAQMRWGALLALLTLLIPFVASILAWTLQAMGFSPEVLAGPFQLLVPVMVVTFLAGVVLALLGFIRRGHGTPARVEDEEW